MLLEVTIIEEVWVDSVVGCDAVVSTDTEKLVVVTSTGVVATLRVVVSV